MTDSIKPKKKFNFLSLPFLAVVISSVFLVLSLTASFLIFKQKPDIFLEIEKIPSISEKDVVSAIKAGVIIDNKVTLPYTRKNTTAMQFTSQGKTYTVFRVNTPETCGQGGCIHIVTALDTLPILLQLFSLKPGEQVFLPSTKAKCFSVVQPDSFKQMKNYEICEK